MSDSDIVQQLQKDVESLATDQGRVPGTSGHSAAQEYLVCRMTESGLKPYAGDSFRLPYEINEMAFCNLVGQIPGLKPELDPVILVAHYDAVPGSPGADDNASAIAILLAAVEPLRSLNCDRSIIFAFFDAEEPPNYLTLSMGSIHFYNHQRISDIHCAVVLDLVGHNIPIASLETIIFITGMETDPALENVIRQSENIQGIRAIPTLNQYVGDMSDHHIFRINNVPYMFLSSGRWPGYHTSSDTIDCVNFFKSAAASQLIVTMVEQMTQCKFEGPFDGYDTTETELCFLRKHLTALQMMFGFQLEDRSDIDNLVALIRGRFNI